MVDRCGMHRGSGVCRSCWKREKRWSIFSDELQTRALVQKTGVGCSKIHVFGALHQSTVTTMSFAGRVEVSLAEVLPHRKETRWVGFWDTWELTSHSEDCEDSWFFRHCVKFLQDVQGGEKLEHHKKATEAGFLGMSLSSCTCVLRIVFKT